jgi:hypothetical protein
MWDLDIVPDSTIEARAGRAGKPDGLGGRDRHAHAEESAGLPHCLPVDHR